MPLTIGTAGHIDHGKTWLVRALTGKDTDRLPEEQRRGISIDLGYAPLELEGGRRLSVVDVPGHERFVRTMVAGATGIDLFLLVVDAGEGPRPQTHEHLAILRLLGIERGVVVVTKADAVDEEVLELAVECARISFLVPRSSPSARGRAPVSTSCAQPSAGRRTGSSRRGWMARRASTSTARSRCVASARWRRGRSGRARSAPETSSYSNPRQGMVRVRSVQVHDRDVERAEAGQRVAVSLPGSRARPRRSVVTLSWSAVATRSRTGSTSCWTSSSPSATAPVFRFTSERRTLPRASSGWASAERSCGWRRRSSLRVAIA